MSTTACVIKSIKDILKWSFICRFYSSLAKNNLGAAAYDFSQIEEGDSKITRVSKNEIAKTYLSMAKECKDSLKEVIRLYRQNGAIPRSLSSYDTNMWFYTRLVDNNPGTPLI